jgi:hypothetical protein
MWKVKLAMQNPKEVMQSVLALFKGRKVSLGVLVSNVPHDPLNHERR